MLKEMSGHYSDDNKATHLEDPVTCRGAEILNALAASIAITDTVLLLCYEDIAGIFARSWWKVGYRKALPFDIRQTNWVDPSFMLYSLESSLHKKFSIPIRFHRTALSEEGPGNASNMMLRSRTVERNHKHLKHRFTLLHNLIWTETK
jgi:hypothetical protein